jgi:hypothetical protein
MTSVQVWLLQVGALRESEEVGLGLAKSRVVWLLVWLWFLNLSIKEVQLAIRITNVEKVLTVDETIVGTARFTKPGRPQRRVERLRAGSLTTVVFVTTNLPRLPMHAGQPAKLRDLGYDEIWLQNWLAHSPARLGLGEVRIVAQELTAPQGGSLDILAADGDTYYSVEVQLGEVDASHSFRVFDYWARNRARFEGKTHVAVLVVESATGRYRPALEALAEYLPLVVIELRAWRGEAEVILVPETVVINQNLDVAGPAGTVSGEARSEADWKASITPEAWAFHDAFIAWTRANLGEVRVDYSPKSYVGIRRGRRVWAPLWFRRDGATIYLPDPDGLRGEQQSPAMDEFQERLRKEGLEAGWQQTYNAGANPIPIRLRKADLAKPVVQELLRATFEILAPSSIPWSERHAEPAADADGTATSELRNSG